LGGIVGIGVSVEGSGEGIVGVLSFSGALGGIPVGMGKHEKSETHIARISILFVCI
jgi:hypothetical protein